MEDEIDLELGEDTLENPFVGDRAGELAADQPGQRGSSGAMSTVTIERPVWASRVISPWPISPLAPVTSTDGVRIWGFFL